MNALPLPLTCEVSSTPCWHDDLHGWQRGYVQRGSALKVSIEVVSNLHHNPRPIDWVQTHQVMLSGKICVGEQLFDWLIDFIAIPISCWREGEEVRSINWSAAEVSKWGTKYVVWVTEQNMRLVANSSCETGNLRTGILVHPWRQQLLDNPTQTIIEGGACNTILMSPSNVNGQHVLASTQQHSLNTDVGSNF